MKILYIDDSPKDREIFKNVIELGWKSLHSDGTVSFPLEVDSQDGIKDTDVAPRAAGIPISQVGSYDAVLIDIIWDNEPIGILYAKEIRERFPEVPVFMLTISQDPKHFNELLGIGIDAYISKSDGEMAFAVYLGLVRARTRHKGQCIAKSVRKVSGNDSIWGSYVDKSVTQIGRYARSHERWLEFWKCFDSPITELRLKGTFDNMCEAFRQSDLLLQGAVGSMRGHLDHVLNVFYTGYVILHLVPGLKADILKMCRDHINTRSSLTTSKAKDEESWRLFLITWLAASTLHDTAYALEILPDVMVKCQDVEQMYSGLIEFSAGTGSSPTAPTSLAQSHLAEIQLMAVQLHGSSFNDFISSSVMFSKNTTTKVNHGVAAGVLLLEHAQKIFELRGQPKSLKRFFTWSALAMALHSLKVPGSKSGRKLSLRSDPLSYLLMICDEIQVWERERLDSNRLDSPFNFIDLLEFDVAGKDVLATLGYIPYDTISDEAIRDIKTKFDRQFENDGEVLGRYLADDGLKVTMRRRAVRSTKPFHSVFDFTDVAF